MSRWSHSTLWSTCTLRTLQCLCFIHKMATTQTTKLFIRKRIDCDLFILKFDIDGKEQLNDELDISISITTYVHFIMVFDICIILNIIARRHFSAVDKVTLSDVLNVWTCKIVHFSMETTKISCYAIKIYCTYRSAVTSNVTNWTFITITSLNNWSSFS